MLETEAHDYDMVFKVSLKKKKKKRCSDSRDKKIHVGISLWLLGWDRNVSSDGIESYLSEICGPPKQGLRNFVISFSKSKVDLLHLWVLLFSLPYLNFGSINSTLRQFQMNFMMLFTSGLLQRVSSSVLFTSLHLPILIQCCLSLFGFGKYVSLIDSWVKINSKAGGMGDWLDFVSWLTNRLRICNFIPSKWTHSIQVQGCTLFSGRKLGKEVACSPPWLRGD